MKADPFAPTLVDEAPMPQLKDAESDIFFLNPSVVEEQPAAPVEEPAQLKLTIKEEDAFDLEKKELELKKQQLNDKFEQLRNNILGNIGQAQNNATGSQASAISGGYLSRPSNIYADQSTPAPKAKSTEDEMLDMQLVIKNEGVSAAKPGSYSSHMSTNPPTEDAASQNIAEEEKRKAAERLQKLRNLSFNINAADPNNELESVPAYIRRNMELHNSSASVENFYSNYSIKAENNNVHISTINTFLDGKKPD